ncbi:hypothetical protein CGS46_01405 [Faecalibacterium langellae]|uniref:Uncharacterized protein n=1 Tax=Faecalibacterium langellae TaxID=3435293 RepID=A0A2A6ZDY9_9FIRM|nr:hypothetical protein CGS46_01405 [Faecalibacterium prausnitzii]RJV97566.1 hypothetical protein DW937_04865 [Faecalibacterium sp. AM43-5AT]
MEPGRPRDAEDGLGAAQVKIEPATGAPVTALRRVLCPAKGCACKGAAKQGGTTKVTSSRPCPAMSGRMRAFFVATNQERKSINL